MKIVATSNFDEETYCERVIVAHVHPFIGKIYTDQLNERWRKKSEFEIEPPTYYRLFPDDYIPWRGMYDLVGEEYPGND